MRSFGRGSSGLPGRPNAGTPATAGLQEFDAQMADAILAPLFLLCVMAVVTSPAGAQVTDYCSRLL
jgi:hypothetical protein